MQLGANILLLFLALVSDGLAHVQAMHTAPAIGYDARNRLIRIEDWTGRVTTIGYDGPSRLVTIARPNGTVRANTWDAASQLTAVMDKQVGSCKPVVALRMDYDLATRLTKKLEVPAWGNIFRLFTRYATYNNDNQLDTLSLTSQTLSYDLDGNTTSAPAAGPNAPLATYGWNARNQLTGGPGGMAYTYDAEGQRTSYSLNGGAPTTFVNDPHGAMPRVLIRIRHDGTRTFYISGPILLYEIEESASGANPANAARYYHYDHLGSTLALTNDTGQVIARANYSAYGERIQTTGNFDTPFAWQGAFGVQTDPNGLHYMRARYYHARLGRFLSEDPLRLAGGSNVYAYANGNPISLNDPLGLCACESRVRTASIDAYDKPFSWSNAITQAASLVPFARNLTEFISGRSLDDPTQPVNRAEAFSRLGIEAALTVATLPLGGEGAVGSRAATEVGGSKLLYHYTTAAESLFANGLREGSSVSDRLYTNAFQASQELGIPIPNKVIPILDVGQFVPGKPPIVQGSNRFIGGGTDFNNLQLVPPSQLLPAQPMGGR